MSNSASDVWSFKKKCCTSYKTIFIKMFHDKNDYFWNLGFVYATKARFGVDIHFTVSTVIKTSKNNHCVYKVCVCVLLILLWWCNDIFSGGEWRRSRSTARRRGSRLFPTATGYIQLSREAACKQWATRQRRSLLGMTRLRGAAKRTTDRRRRSLPTRQRINATGYRRRVDTAVYNGQRSAAPLNVSRLATRGRTTQRVVATGGVFSFLAQKKKKTVINWIMNL